MKKLFKNLMPMLLLVAGLGISPNAWGYGATDGNIYFDNTKAQWSNYINIVIGRDHSWGGNDGVYNQVIKMSNITNTKLYYKKLSWDKYDSFLFNSTSTDWGDSGTGDSPDTRATLGDNYSGEYNVDFNSGKCYLFTPKTNSKGAGLDYSGEKSDYTFLNKTQTVKVMVKKAGESSYTEEETFANWPATIKAKRYKLNSNGASKADETDADLTSATFTSVITSTAKIYVPTPSTGYTFKGWGTSSSATPSDASSAYEYTVDNTKTIYLFFEENAYYIKHGWKDGLDASWTYKPLTANGDGTFYIDDWYGGTGCDWRFLSDGNEKWIGEPTLDNEPAKGDKCIFTLNPTANSGNGTITITPKTYTLTLDNKGGSTEPSSLVVTYGKTCPDFTIPTKTGYKFSGYNKQNTTSESSRVINQGKTFKATQSGYTQESRWIRDEAVTLDAIWTAQSYNITYKDQGGVTFTGSWTDITYPTKHTYGETTTLVAPNNKTGYTFGGWYKTSDCSGEAVTEIGGTDYTNNFTLYAKWNPTTTTITIYKNDQGVAYQDEPTIQMTATYDAVMPATAATNWTRTGYNLNNFYLERGCTKIITSANVKYAQSKTYDDVVYTNGSSDPLWKFTGTTLDWYARWTAKIYTITFYPNGGSSEQYDKTATYDSRTGIANCTKPTHATANFAGYYLNEEGTGDPLYNAECALQSNVAGYTDASGNWIHDGNVEVYAKWTSSYVVTLNNMDATSAGTQNVEVEQGKTTGLTSPITCPEKTGYTFGGYFTAASGEGTKVIDATGSWVIPAEGYIDNEGKWIPANGAEFKAYWIANKTTVTFDNQSATSAGTTSRTIAYNSTDFGQAFVAPTKTGYTFGGYFTSTNGEGTQLISAEGAWIAGVEGYTADPLKWIKTTTDALTLYAKWTAITYTINYEGNGNTGGSTESSTHTYDVAKALTTNGFTRAYTVTYNYNGATGGNSEANAVANYTFANWTFNETNYTDGQEVTNLASTQGAEVTMTAQWTPTSVTLPSPAKTGYNFTGWYNNSALIGNAGASYIPTADIALTAQWTAKTYTISFDQNGGTDGQTESVTATYDQPMPTPITLPTRVGYKFLGYEYNGTLYYNADGTSASTWNVDNNVTLTAKWDQIHVYIEGRFKVRASAEGDWKYVATNGTWTINSTNIEFEFDTETNKYVLHTYAYFDELAEQISSQTPYFYPASYCESEGNFHELGATSENYQFNKTVKSGATTGKNNFVFGNNCHDSSVDLIYDPVNHTLSYESVAEPHYNVTFIAGGQGHINEHTNDKQFVASVGVRGGWNVTAHPSDAYKFDHWSTTGGAHVANASSASTAVTVDGDGTVTANFVFNKKRVYFKMPKDWVDAKFTKVYVYFYKGAYWNEANNGSGSKDIQHGPHQMTWTGDGNVYYYDVDFDLASSVISFTNDEQSGYERFNGTSVCYREDFDQNFSSAKMMFVPDNWITHTYYCDKKTDYYNNGSWQLYSNAPEEYYVKHDHTNPAWATLSELRFEPTENNNIRKTILRDLTANDEYKFKIWKSTDNWYGCTATITGNVDNYIFSYGNGDNCILKPKYAGNYELTLNVSDMLLSVRYLADFYIRSFPEAVSVVPNGIKRIEPKIDLRDEYDVEKLTVTISNTDNGVATVEQSGYNIIVTGKQNGTTTATITYNYNGNVFAYNLTIVVGPAVTIQAKIEEGDGKWIYTNMVNVHYWLSGKTADVNMKYTESGTEKYYTASIPLPEDQETFNMMFWYGENINMSSSEVWRKTGNIENLNIYTSAGKPNTQSYCFTIKHSNGDDKQRTETHTTGLCIQGDAIYQVEVTMKNGKMYTSNVVSTDGATVSFFAPNYSATDYTQGTIRLMKNGTEIMQTIENTNPGVYTATLNIPTEGNATLSNITPYAGDYYVLSGLSSAEKNNASKMIEFTRQPGEAFSYYWVAFSNDCPSKNANATLANAYNDNLSIAIGSDKKTDSEGNVESGNVRFSYEPTTNEFKRAVIGGSTENPKFLALVGNNVYDTDGTIALDDVQYALPDTKCKFTDASDWVYEKNIVIKPDGENDANVYIKSQFNGELTELLGYEINPTTGEETTIPKPLTVMGKATTSGEYEIRIIYDYKKNRLLSAWEPQEQTISTDMTIESDVMFIGQEDEDVKQVTIGNVTDPSTSKTRAAKLTSLQHVMYVKEFLQSETLKTYWMSLPFDCRISDIYGIGGYGTVWRIQEYDGASRAANGWLHESQTFWKTMSMDDEMKAGYGYLLQIVRSKMDFHQIDGKAALRLYFPSKEVGFTMTRSDVGETINYPVENCPIKGREAEDSNWKLMGPLAYNNIEVKEVDWDVTASKPEDVTRFPSYLYEYDAVNKTYNVVSATDREYRSFHAFMTQFGGTIEWAPYTQTKPGEAPRFADLSSSFKGGRLTIELVQSEETLDRTFVTLSQYGTEGFDQNKDLTKIAESRSTISTITNNVEYAGNTLPLDIETVPLNVKVTANGTYDIVLNESLNGLEVRLYDAFEQTTTPLDMMSATVTLEKGEYKDRFFLQFKQKGSDTPTSFDGKIEQYNLPMDKTQKLLFNSNIYLINGGRVYNATGLQLR